MASYHLSVKTVKRSVGRSSTAASAYRAGVELYCDREGRVHDYRAKQGVREAFIVAPADAPDWASDRNELWNAVEVRETRRNSVTAREWELALPSEISDEARRELAQGFAQSLVDRYGVVADVAIHDPHREGDQRNHHAHVLTTTRVMEPEGLTQKTRVLDAAKTGGVEIAAMRETWADMQNLALELEGVKQRVDHRSLEAQRDVAIKRGDVLEADALDRPAEVKLGPAANAMERRAVREAEKQGVAYEPVTERGRQVHEVRETRALFEELWVRVERARGVYVEARDDGMDRVSAGLKALRAAVEKQGQGGDAVDELGPSVEERLKGVLEEKPDVGVEAELGETAGINERLKDVLGRADHKGVRTSRSRADGEGAGVADEPRQQPWDDAKPKPEDEIERKPKLRRPGLER